MSESTEALTSKEAEIERLREGICERDARLKTLEAAAAERLAAFQQVHAELEAIRAEALKRSHDQERLIAELDARDLRIAALEKTAEERQQAILEAHAALRSVHHAEGNANKMWRICTRTASTLFGAFSRK